MSGNGGPPARGRSGADRSHFFRAGPLLPMVLVVLACAPAETLSQSPAPAPSDNDAAGVPARAFLLSAVLPGLGQRQVEQKRWLGFVLADALSWVAFSESRRAGRGLEEAYRELAWVAARDRIEPRRDGDWQYYEELVKFGASGALDVEPGRAGVQPETDPLTHNGTIWALARELFLPGGVAEEGDPEWDRALEYYLRRGIPPEFAWDWKENGSARSSYRSLIDASDRERRHSVGYAGVLLANRVLSVVDLYITSRTGGEAPLSSRLGARWDPVASRPWILVRLPAP